MKGDLKDNRKGDDGLTNKQRAFVFNYLANGYNATQAAIKAGYSEQTAYSQGQRLLKNVEVHAVIEQRKADVKEVANITIERCLKEYAKIAFADISAAFDEQENLKPMHEIPENVRQIISGFEVQTCKSGSKLKKMKFAQKKDALDSIMRHLGGFDADRSKEQQVKIIIEQSGKVNTDKM